jgi:glycopeptide antibiotics resistance protein
MQVKLRKPNLGKIIMWALFILYLTLLIKVILFKYPAFVIANSFKYAHETPLFTRITQGNFIPFKTILHYLGGNPSFGVAKENLLGNIIAFGPLGFLLPIVIKGIKDVKHIALSAFIVSLTFEVIQLLTYLGSFDVDDIILNVLGAMCGYLVYKVFFLLIPKRIKSQTSS